MAKTVKKPRKGVLQAPSNCSTTAAKNRKYHYTTVTAGNLDKISQNFSNLASIFSDDNEDDEDEEGVTPFGEETWNDLALDSFLQHLESSEANASQSASTVAAEAQAAAMQALRQGGDALPQGGGLNTSARSDED